MGFACDVTKEASVDAAVAAIEKALGQVDILVNNAGVTKDNVFLRLSDADWDTVLEANLKGAFRTIRAASRGMMKKRWGRIINVSSRGGQLSDMGTWSPAYCISKTALNGVTVQLAAALPNFAVNSVCPGWVRTDMGGPGATKPVEEGADTGQAICDVC